MSTVYQLPILSWPFPDEYPGGVLVSGVPTQQIGVSDGVTSTVLEFPRSGHVFPDLAPALENHLNTEWDFTSTVSWAVRWIFDGGQPFPPSLGFSGNWPTFTDRRAMEPKLGIAVNAFMGPTVTITWGSPTQILTPALRADNWIGTATPTTAVNLGSPGGGVLAMPPQFLWQPQTLSWGDDRTLRRSAGISTSPYTNRKWVQEWGSRVSRNLTFPLVHATQMYSYRRYNPFFEESAIRRASRNNLWECLWDSTASDLVYHIYTQLGDVSLNLAPYMAGFRYRESRLNDLIDTSDGHSFQGDEQRLYDVAIEFTESLTQVGLGL